MAHSYKAHCLVLKKTKLGESDLILTMLDDVGHQVRGVAKGARKPGNRRFGARLEPFSEVELVLYPGRSLEQITEVKCLDPHAACREDLMRSCACNVVSELLDKFTRDGEAGERIFPMTQAVFDGIEKSPQSASSVLACAYLLKACAMQGLRPAVHSCAACGDALESFDAFDIASGGALCESCAAQLNASGWMAIDEALAHWVDALVVSTFTQIAAFEDAPVIPLIDFCQAWLREHLGLSLKTLTFLKTML